MMRETTSGRYGPIKGAVLLGGGVILRQLSLQLLSSGLPVKVISAPRHVKEVENGVTLIEFLNQQQIECLVVDRVENPSVASFLERTDEYFYLSLGAAWIFNSEAIKKLFNNQLFNLHGTRLPQNRGGGGFSWQIMMGNRFGFCVMHRVDGGIDTGDIIAAQEFLYPPSARTPKDYEEIYIRKNVDFVAEFIEAHRNDSMELELIRQSEWFSSYWPRLNTMLSGFIDWGLHADEIERFICAFDSPYKGASTFLGAKRVFVKKVSVSASDGCFHPFQNGLIYRKTTSWLCVALKGATLIIEDIRDEDGNCLISDVKVGDRLHTPRNFLEDAIARIIYTPVGLKG
jgi:methionyl-tRNA formyltransferase